MGTRFVALALINALCWGAISAGTAIAGAQPGYQDNRRSGSQATEAPRQEQRAAPAPREYPRFPDNAPSHPWRNEPAEGAPLGSGASAQHRWTATQPREVNPRTLGGAAPTRQVDGPSYHYRGQTRHAVQAPRYHSPYLMYVLRYEVGSCLPPDLISEAYIVPDPPALGLPVPEGDDRWIRVNLDLYLTDENRCVTDAIFGFFVEVDDDSPPP